MKRGKSEKYTSVTIKDVAKAAGVSIATVSRILNRSAGVSSELEKKVRQAIEALGYYTNDAARTLKGKESYSLGLIIPDIQNPFFPALVRSIEDAARFHDHAVLLCNSDGDVEEESRYIRFLHGKRVDGVLFISGPNSAASVDLAASFNMPMVLLDRQVKGRELSAVLPDNRYGAQLAVQTLLECGCRKIAFIGNRSLSSAGERFEGYCEVLAAYGLALAEPLIMEQPFTFDGGFQGVAALLEAKADFDALFVGNDVMAFGAIACLRQHGLRVPEDVQVVGFDDIWMAKWHNPPLTTLCQPVDAIGQAAVQMLLDLRGCSEKRVVKRRFQPALVFRESTLKMRKQAGD